MMLMMREREIAHVAEERKGMERTRGGSRWSRIEKNTAKIAI